VKYREIMKLVEEDGWMHTRTAGSHRVYHHPSKSGIVVIAGHPNADVPKGTLSSILKQAGIKQP
jgi:predicted RNA binding protein YcfA (HicA-like mRNA interferase family)